MEKRTRRLALVLVLALALLMLAAPILTLSHTHAHTHDHGMAVEECALCREIVTLTEAARRLSVLPVLALAVACAWVLLHVTGEKGALILAPHTLVAEKVKLSN